MSERKIILSPFQRILGEDFNPALLVIIIRKSFVWCVVIILLTTAISLLFLRYTAPIYEAGASLIVKPVNTAQALDIQNPIFQGKDANEDLQRDIQIMKSSVVIGRAIDMLNMKVSYYRKGQILDEEMYNNSPFEIKATPIDSTIENLKIQIKFDKNKNVTLYYDDGTYKLDDNLKLNQPHTNKYFSLLVTMSPGYEATYDQLIGGEYFFVMNNRQTLINQYRNDLLIAPYPPIVAINIRDMKPQKAADVVNAMSVAFIQYDKEKKAESANQILGFIEDQLDT